MKQTSSDQVVDYIQSSTFHLDALRTVDNLDLPDWAIGAGFVRNLVWDKLHGYSRITPLNDIDVLFFDKNNVAPEYEYEKEMENLLTTHNSEVNWSVRNQARMHIRNNDQPYTSTIDAMKFWLETPTCIAARLKKDGKIEIIAPHGLEDLLKLSVRPTLAGKSKRDEYAERLKDKNWLVNWPNLKLETT